jgi:DHA2 family multidrug resistance protein
MLAMFLAGRLANILDPRLLLLTGLVLSAGSLLEMSFFNLDVSFAALVGTGIVQGMGLGFLFVPVSVVAFATLPMAHRTEASGVFSLARNIGSSIGVSLLSGMLARYVQINRAWLVEHITPFSIAMSDPRLADLDPHDPAGAMQLSAMVTREAMMLGYVDDFRAMVVITLAAAPLLLLLRPMKRQHSP